MTLIPRLLNRLGLPMALGATLAATGCDSSARIYQQRVTFQYAEIVSAYPGQKQSDGSWRPVCDASAADGLLTNVALVSSQRKPAAGEIRSSDRDQGIRPGDVIESRVVEGGLPDDINLSNVANLGMEYACVAPVPGGTCPASGPSTPLSSMRYAANTADRDIAHNVLLLIDNSGSTAGLVNEGTFKEGKPGDVVFPLNFGNVASDRNDERLAVARKLLEDLNPTDNFGAIAFGEGDGTSATLQFPCNAPVPSLDACFGINRSVWSGAGGIPTLGSKEGGRSNLWQAVRTAYDFLKTRRDQTRSNHIIVVTDGPDTCAPGENLGSCQTACSTVGYDDFREAFEADLNDPNRVPIRIHFIQFESVGYPGRDPRQVEMSCLSGGHYQHINSNGLPSDQASQLNLAMQTAMNNVRFSLQGHWQVASEFPAYPIDSQNGVPPGSLYALSGTFTIKAASNLQRIDVRTGFDVGRGGATGIPAGWDHRPTIRKPCTASTQCGAAGEGSGCQVVCSEETLVCPNGATGVTAPNLFACDSGGAPGFCCEGTCEPLSAGACAACSGG
jgi:hypothetical protein